MTAASDPIGISADQHEKLREAAWEVFKYSPYYNLGIDKAAFWFAFDQGFLEGHRLGIDLGFNEGQFKQARERK